MDNAAEDVEAVKKSLVELAENAWADKSFHGKVSFKPSQKLKEKIKELMGHDISEVFITADNMRHLRNHHGEAEEKRGQVNFKPEMAGEIYDVVNDFDSATKERNDNKGNQNVLVVRKGNGDSFALLVERGKKKAEVKTFYKKTKTPLMSDAKSPNLNAQSDSVKSSVTSSVSQEQENVERENSDTNVLKGVEGLWESTINDYIDRGFVIESYKGHKEGKKVVYDLTFESEQERLRFIDDYYGESEEGDEITEDDYKAEETTQEKTAEEKAPAQESQFGDEAENEKDFPEALGITEDETEEVSFGNEFGGTTDEEIEVLKKELQK